MSCCGCEFQLLRLPSHSRLLLSVNTSHILRSQPSIAFGIQYVSRDQNAGRTRTVKIDNNSFEGMEEFTYLGTTLTNQEEIKSRLQSGTACYLSVQNLLSSSLFSKNLKFRIYWTIILPVVLCGCETWSLALREERRLRVFESRVLRTILGLRGMR